MRHARFAAFALVAVVLLPTALALMPEPATAAAKRTDTLFRVINGIAIVIGVVVEVILLYLLWKFYKNKNVPRDTGHRGHTRLEIAWTFAPVVILVFLTYQTVVVMQQNETLPGDLAGDAVEVGVVGSQFSWTFTIPGEDEPSPNGFRVREGQVVRLNVSSADVAHAFNVPELNLMVDAYPPPRWSEVWFIAPAYVEAAGSADGTSGGYFPKPDPNAYLIQCREYCGVGHGYMGPANPDADSRPRIVVEPKSADLAVGPLVKKVDVCATELPSGAATQGVVLNERGGSGATPYSIDPSTMSFPAGSSVRFEATIEGRGAHNLAFPSLGAKTPDFLAPAKRCLDVSFPSTPGPIEYICAIPGHAELGMRGTLTLT